MTVLRDLQFDELLAQLPAGSIALNGSDIVISVSTLTGDSYAAITDTGVAEALYKLVLAANTAQDTANAALDPAVDTLLAAFGDPALGVPDDGNNVPVSVTLNFDIPLNVDSVLGAN